MNSVQGVSSAPGGYMEPQFDIQAYITIVRRRWLYVVVPAVLIGLASVLLAYWLPPIYEASATVLVESQQIPTDLAAPTVTSDASGRIQIIQQRLLTRDNLLQIASKFDLYTYEGSQRTPTTIVDEMRAAVSIDQIDVGSARPTTGVIGFTVKFKYRDATVSSRVTNEFVSSILSQNIEARLSRASDTSNFLEQQQKDIEAQLLAFEAKIADFKRANDDTLPETLPTRRQELAQLASQIGDVDQKIQAANLSGNATGLDANSASTQQLGFTLQAKQVELDSDRKEREQLTPAFEKGFIAANRIRDLDRNIAIAELNVAALQAQISAQGGATTSEAALKLLQSLRSELTAQADILTANIAKTPATEAELNAMTRDYANLQDEYHQAQARLADALTGERLEQDRQGERFEVIEQATAPDLPTEPNRPRVMIVGSLGGVAFGVGLLVLLELLDKKLHNARDLERKLGIQAIAVIPYVTTATEVRLKSLRNLIIGIGIAALVGVMLLVVHLYFVPLDVIAEWIWLKASKLLPSGPSGTLGSQN